MTPAETQTESAAKQLRPFEQKPESDAKAKTENGLVVQSVDLRQTPNQWRQCLKNNQSDDASKGSLNCLGFPNLELSPVKTEATNWDEVKIHLNFVDLPGGGKILAGTDVKRDVEPANYRTGEKTDGKPELVIDIARKRLGEDASVKDIANYIVEIQLSNEDHIDQNLPLDKRTARPGVNLVLPGHTSEGDTSYVSANQTRITYEHNGNIEIKYKDGSGYLRSELKQNDQTLIKDSHFDSMGKPLGDIIKDSSGNIVSDTRPDQAPDTVSNERRKLVHLAQSTLTIEKEQKELLANMESFEKRAKEEGLKPGEVAAAYRDLSSILSVKGNSPLTARERVRLVEGAMKAAASPRSNDQGEYETCQTIVTENRLYAKQPSTITSMLSQIAHHGSFTAKDGTRVDMLAENLRAHGQAALNSPMGSDVRTYTSQVVETAAINALMAKRGLEKVPPVDMRFMQSTHVLDGSPTAAKDNGERMAGFFGEQPIVLKASAAEAVQNPEGITRMHTIMTGEYRPELFLRNAKNAANTTENNVGSRFSSVEELAQHLQKLKETDGKNGPIYAAIEVRGNSDTLLPTRSHSPLDVKPSEETRRRDAHLLNIYDYDAKTGRVKIDNQWGNKYDFIEKPITVAQLYNATEEVHTVEWMNRLQANKGKMKPADFDAHLSDMMNNMIDQAKLPSSNPARLSAELKESINTYKKLREGRSSKLLSETDKQLSALGAW